MYFFIRFRASFILVLTIFIDLGFTSEETVEVLTEKPVLSDTFAGTEFASDVKPKSVKTVKTKMKDARNLMKKYMSLGISMAKIAQNEDKLSRDTASPKRSQQDHKMLRALQKLRKYTTKRMNQLRPGIVDCKNNVKALKIMVTKIGLKLATASGSARKYQEKKLKATMKVLKQHKTKCRAKIARYVQHNDKLKHTVSQLYRNQKKTTPATTPA
jgi:hypothetical protein